MKPNPRLLKIAAEIARSHPASIDALPYTPLFDDLYSQFIDRAGQACSRHDFWQSMLGARKRGLVGPRKRARRTA